MYVPTGVIGSRGIGILASWHVEWLPQGPEAVVRVVEVIKGFGLGGSETSLVNRLDSAPLEVKTRVLILDGEDSTLASRLDHHATVDKLPRGTDPRQLVALLESDDPDVVLVHNPVVAVTYLPIILRRNFRVVVVAHNSRLSDYRSRDLVLRWPMRRINARVAGHIAVSPAAEAGPWCAGSRRVITVPLGSSTEMDSGHYVSPWPKDSRVKLLALGRLAPAKQVLKLTDAVLGLGDFFRSEAAHLAVVGSGSQEAAIRRKIKASGRQDIISLHAATSTPGPYYLEADWLLISSLYEGGPLTAYEAAISGTGLAGTPVGILPELLKSYPQGLLAEGHSSKSLRSLLERAVRIGATSQDARAIRSEVGQYWQSSNLTPIFYDAVRRLTWDKQ